MKLCECGCGFPVNNIQSRFIRGHHRRGVKCDLSISEKRKETNRTKYGVDHPMKLDYTKKKFEKTMVEKYGEKHALQSNKIFKKYKQTCLENYHTDNVFKNVDIKEKSKLTRLKKYGVEYTGQIQSVKEKIQKTIIQKYGVDNYSKTLEFRKLAREKMIETIKSGLKNGQSFSPSKGKNEIDFIKILQENIEFFIDNDSKIESYFPDGYIKELNLVIEFDEPYHEKKCYKEHDNIKDKTYRSLNLIVFRVKELDWLSDKDSIINNFKLLIESLSK